MSTPARTASSGPTPDNVVPLGVLALLRRGEAVRPITDAPGYFATTHGRIISTRRKEPRVLKAWPATNGYLQVDLAVGEREDGSRRPWCPLVHRLILLTFEGPPPTDPTDPHAVYECCHRDGDRKNNTLSNLRWAPRAVNQRDRYRHGYRAGKEAGTGLTPVAVWELRCRALTEPVAELAAEFAQAYGVSARAVRVALRGRRDWRWVPFPQEAPTVAELARVLGVTEGRAAELLALAHPGDFRKAA